MVKRILIGAAGLVFGTGLALVASWFLADLRLGPGRIDVTPRPLMRVLPEAETRRERRALRRLQREESQRIARAPEAGERLMTAILDCASCHGDDLGGGRLSLGALFAVVGPGSDHVRDLGLGRCNRCFRIRRDCLQPLRNYAGHGLVFSESIWFGPSRRGSGGLHGGCFPCDRSRFFQRCAVDGRGRSRTGLGGGT